MPGRTRDAAVQAVMKLFRYASKIGSITQGEVVAVRKGDTQSNPNTCDVKIAGNVFYNLPLKVWKGVSNFMVYPKIGTSCDVFFYGANTQAPSILDFQDAESIALLDQSDIDISAEQITVNGGDLGGLVIVGKLTERLNKLEGQINDIQSAISSHTHAVVVGGNSGATSSITYTKVKLTPFANSDYENEKIKQ